MKFKSMQTYTIYYLAMHMYIGKSIDKRKKRISTSLRAVVGLGEEEVMEKGVEHHSLLRSLSRIACLPNIK